MSTIKLRDKQRTGGCGGGKEESGAGRPAALSSITATTYDLLRRSLMFCDGQSTSVVAMGRITIEKLRQKVKLSDYIYIAARGGR